MADLVTLAEVKDFMNKPGTDEDVRLGILVSGVSEEIQKWVGRALTTKTYINEVHSVQEAAVRRVGTKHRPLVQPAASGTVDVRPLVATVSDQGFRFNDGDVDAGTDQIAEVAHGLATEDGPFILVSSGTLPTGLTQLSQDYYVIRVDADNVQLATTKALAKAGTQVDITAAAGKGSHFLVGPNILDKDLEVENATGGVYQANGVWWPRGFHHIKLAYAAGYGTAGNGMAADLIQAAVKQVAFEHLYTGTKGRLGRKSSVLTSGAQENFVVQEWAPGVLALIAGYKFRGISHGPS